METKQNTSLGAMVFVWLLAVGAIWYFSPFGQTLNLVLLAVLTVLILVGNLQL